MKQDYNEMYRVSEVILCIANRPFNAPTKIVVYEISFKRLYFIMSIVAINGVRLTGADYNITILKLP